MLYTRAVCILNVYIICYADLNFYYVLNVCCVCSIFGPIFYMCSTQMFVCSM